MAIKESERPQILTPEDREDLSQPVDIVVPAEASDEYQPQEPDLLAQQVQQVNAADLARQQQIAYARQHQEEQIRHERRERNQAEFDSIVHAAEATRQEIENLKGQLQVALALNDHIEATNVQVALNNAQIRLHDLDLRGEHYGEEPQQQQYEQPPQQQYQQPQQQATPADVINSMANLHPNAKAWLMRHQELVTSQVGADRLKGAHWDAEAQGLVHGTPEYLEFFDRRFGFDNGNGQAMEQQPAQKPRPQPNRQVSAPVSRSGVNVGTGRPQETSGRVQLTPQQREAARVLDGLLCGSIESSF
jgi:hypothetical protein